MEIVGYSNYLIYPDGKVSSKRFPDRYLKQGTRRGGYKYVTLCKDEKPKKYLVHRLVAEHYIPNPENKPLINHKNGIKTDNRIENLEWCTSSENNRHAHQMGLNYISDLNKIRRGKKIS